MFVFKGLFWVSIVTICKFNKLECVGMGGVIGVWFFSGAPSIHSICGLSLDKHRHGGFV